MKHELTPDFPSELLVAESGTLSQHAEKFFIQINLRPFSYDYEDVNESLELANLHFPVDNIQELSGKEFVYPPNPSEGFVESSLYLWSVHNPIDVLRITFGEVVGDSIGASFDMKFAFEYEGNCNNLEKRLSIALKIH